MLVQIPHRFFAERASELGFVLPAPGDYAVGAFFLPRDAEGRRIVEAIVEKMVAAEGQILLGWRDTPVDSSCLGESVKPAEPVSRQIFIKRGPNTGDQDVFERRLFILRKTISNAVYNLRDRRTAGFYPVSLSSRTLVYKGLLLATKLGVYYQGSRRPLVRIGAFARSSALFDEHLSDLVAWRIPIAMSRIMARSTRCAAIVNWMAARQASVASSLFGRRHQQALADFL